MANSRTLLRYWLATICIVLAWLYPFAKSPIAHAENQIFCLFMVTIAIMLMCPYPKVHRGIVWLALGICLLALSLPITYFGKQIPLIGGWLLFIIAVIAGANINTSSAEKTSPALLCFLIATVVASSISSLQGLLQYFGLADGLWPWIPETLQRGIAFGSFRQPNLFATFLVCGAACTLWLFQLQRLSQSMAWLLVVLLITGVAASSSRAGGVEVCAISLVGLLWLRHQSAPLSRLMIGQIVVFVLAMQALSALAILHGFEPRTLAARISNLNSDNRWQVWSDSVRLIAERPWTGWGWSEFAYGHYITVLSNRFAPDSVLDNAHNFPLQVAVEFGLPFALLFCGLILYVAIKSRPWHAPTKPHAFAWIILLAIGLHSMVEFPLWYFGFIFLAGFSLGCLIGTPIASSSYQTKSTRVYYSIIVLLTMMCALAWMQYDKVATVYAFPANQKQARLVVLEQAKNAWLFEAEVAYAELGLWDVNEQTAADIRLKTEKLLHFSAEPRVIQKLILSLWYLKDVPALQFHAQRYCQAFPEAYMRWVNTNHTHGMMTQVREHEDVCRLKPVPM